MSQAENYSAQRTTLDGIEIVQLTDAAHKTQVSIIPSIGNMAYELKVNGANVFWWPYQSLADFKAKPGFAGNPFLGPWANRLDQDAFYANGHKYSLNPDLGNIRRDEFKHPIHGFLSYVPWEASSVGSDTNSAWVSSKLEFWKHPEWMAQFPFAHNLVMTYRLHDGALEVKLMIENFATEPMPLSIGFHPYFRVPDAARDQWTVHVAAREHVRLSDQLIPTGQTNPVELPDPYPLAGGQLDDVFSALQRDANGLATFWAKGAKQRLSVVYGPNYAVAVVYAPKRKEFICFEPMTAITNAMNLAHAGLYASLPYVPAGGHWEESFWIRPEGF
jgi:aldose 1-epimerase